MFITPIAHPGLFLATLVVMAAATSVDAGENGPGLPPLLIISPQPPPPQPSLCRNIWALREAAPLARETLAELGEDGFESWMAALAATVCFQKMHPALRPSHPVELTACLPLSEESRASTLLKQALSATHVERLRTLPAHDPALDRQLAEGPFRVLILLPSMGLYSVLESHRSTLALQHLAEAKREHRFRASWFLWLEGGDRKVIAHWSLGPDLLAHPNPAARVSSLIGAYLNGEEQGGAGRPTWRGPLVGRLVLVIPGTRVRLLDARGETLSVWTSTQIVEALHLYRRSLSPFFATQHPSVSMQLSIIEGSDPDDLEVTTFGPLHR